MLPLIEQGHSPVGHNGNLISSESLSLREGVRSLVTTQKYYMNGIHTGLLSRPESLQMENVVRAMLPNSISTRDRYGVVHSVTDTDSELFVGDAKIADLEPLDSDTSRSVGEDEPRLRRVVPGSFRQDNTYDLADSWTVPARTYGDMHLMQVNLSGRGDQPNFIDINTHQLEWMMRDWSWFTQELTGRYGQAAIGANLSFGCLDGRGIMSMMTVHNHAWADAEMRGLNTDKILKSRALPWKNAPEVSGWDGGIAHQIGDTLRKEIETEILQYSGYRGTAQSDDMGVVIDLQDFEPKMIAEPKFVEAWRWLSWSVHNHLKDYHERYFDSRFEDCVNYSIAAHNPGVTVDLERYHNLFVKKSGQNGDSRNNETLTHLDELKLLRNGFGWAWGIHFRSDGTATAALTLGIIDRAFGPVETLGTELKRIEQVLPVVKSEQKTQAYAALADSYHRTHRYM